MCLKRSWKEERMVFFVQSMTPTHSLQRRAHVLHRCKTEIHRPRSDQPYVVKRTVIVAKKSDGEKPSPPGGKSKDGPANSQQKKKGFFGRLTENILRPIVTVPGGGKGGDLLDCVFCKGSGVRDCDACKGTGKDALGMCFMCEGKTQLKCAVCNGVGKVDRIRRGGTDDRNEYTVKKRK